MWTLMEDIAEYIEDIGLGKYDKYGTTGTIFVEALPDTPDNCIAIYNRYGQFTEDGTRLTEIQLLVRDRVRINAHAIGCKLIKAFYHKDNMKLGRHIVIECECESSPIFIGSDSQDRYEFSINLKMEV